MKMRKMGMLLLFIAMIGLMLQGCASTNSGGNGSGKGDRSVKGTIRVWGDLSNQQVLETPFKEINAAFQDKYPNIELKFDFAQNDQSLNVALQANELPDLFMVQGNKTPKMAEMVANGFLMPLDEYDIDLSRFSEAEIEYGTVDGKLYSSLPSFFDTNVVYYNKALFEEHGVEVPTTWDEFISVLDTLKGKGVTPIALPGKSKWDRSWPIFALAPAHANDAMDKIMKGEGDLLQPEIAQSLQYFRDFAEAGYFGKDYVATDGAGAKFAFTNGKAAMIVDGTWSNPTYVESGIDLGRFSIPNEDGKRIVQSSFSNFMTYAVSSKTKSPEAAVKYIEFLNSLEAQQIMEDHNGLVPTIKDIVPMNEGVKELAQFDVAGWNLYSVLSSLATPEANTADMLLDEVIPKLMTSEISGEEGAKILHDAAKYE